MAKQVIGVGSQPDDGTGDTLRAAFIKVNDNFTELYDDDAADNLDAVTTLGNTTTNSITVGGLVVDTDTLVVDSANNRVGIGTDNPTSVLHISDTTPEIYLEDSNNTADAKLLANNGNLGLFSDVNNQYASSIMYFNVDGSERMRIDSSGNVGIGTTSPSAKLHTVGEIVGANATGFTSGMIGFTGLGSYNSSTAVENIDALYLRKGGSDGSSTSIAFASASGDDYFVGSRIKFIRTGSNSKGHLAFETKADTSTNTTVERMRIEDGGNVGIGTTSPIGLLELYKGDSGQTSVVAGGDNLVLNDSANGGMTILTPSTAIGSIFFGDEADNDVGYLRYDHSSNEMWFGVSGSRPITINSSGNVGIGTTSPNELLHLNVGDSGTNYLQFTNLTTGTGSTDGMLVGLGNGEEATIWQFENNHMRFGTNNTERMRIDSLGRLAIGTSSPAAGAILDITATNKGVLLPRMTTTTINTIQSPENGLMVYNTTLNTICFYNGSSWQKVTTSNM